MSSAVQKELLQSADIRAVDREAREAVIRDGLEAGEPVREIARRAEVHPATVRRRRSDQSLSDLLKAIDTARRDQAAISAASRQTRRYLGKDGHDDSSGCKTRGVPRTYKKGAIYFHHTAGRGGAEGAESWVVKKERDR
ncbi:MAG: hypothetical protein EOM52_12960 [Clostridia bacterium]|nr:hypothetical protein [Clostridia bacterium]